MEKEADLIFSKSKYVRVSPKKTAPIMTLVRGKKYEEAIRILTFVDGKPAKLVLKTLKSAGANASHNNSLKAENLLVKEAYVGAGPLLKRQRIVGKSRTSPILKRTSHIIIGLTEVK
ncbi:MAG: 50S ribosomal protein L22 [Patescibacteria group bacterium]